ncbi:Cap [Circular ssDNA virus sp.]|nr:Cap [Circular ssDNA virus sp.]
MYGRRGYSRVYRRGYSRSVKPVKYSNETYNSNITYTYDGSTPGTKYITLIDAISQTGMRKVKNFTLSITQSTVHNSSGATKAASSFVYALIYLPDGVSVTSLNVGSGSNSVSLYEPNQNVIMSGVCSSDNGQLRLSTRLARNLNSGDKILLLFRPSNTAPGTSGDYVNISSICNYSISF